MTLSAADRQIVARAIQRTQIASPPPRDAHQPGDGNGSHALTVSGSIFEGLCRLCGEPSEQRLCSACDWWADWS